MRRLPPERRAARLLRGRLASLAEEMALEAKSKKVRISAEFVWTKESKGVMGIRVWVEDKAENERGPDGKPQPYGTRLVFEAWDVASRKLKEL